MAADLPMSTRWADAVVQQRDLPALTVQAHAANLLALPDGDVLCAWFGGTQEGLADIDIHLARLGAGADSWSAPATLSGDRDRSEQNPVLFLAPDGTIWLFWTAQVAGAQDGAEVRVRRSRDLGRTWGAAEVLFRPDGAGGVFVRHPPVVRHDGAWVLPVFRCGTVEGEAWSGDADHSAVRISLDGGANWSEYSVEGSDGLVHMSIAPTVDGFAAVYRSRYADVVHRSAAGPDAESWTEPEPTALPNNNASIQAIAWSAGELLMVYNHSSAADAVARRASLYDEIEGGEIRAGSAPTSIDLGNSRRRAFWGAPRAPLSLASSRDDGRTWERIADLVTGDGYCLTNNSRDGLNRELSYPTLARSADGALHVAYTHHRRVIRHLRISLN